MIGPSSIKQRIWMVQLVTALVTLAVPAAATAWCQDSSRGAAATTKLSEAEKTRRLAELRQHRSEALRLANSGRRDDAIKEAEAALAIEREVLGELHEDVVVRLEFLAREREVGADREGARNALMQVLSIRERQPDRKDWRTGDARRALADFDRRAAMTPDDRLRLREADALVRLSEKLRGQAKYEAAIGACRKAMEIRRRLLGENNPDYAQSLSNLGVLYQAMGDHARAEPDFREALAIRKRALGENHPDYAGSLHNLAALYAAMNDYARAEPLYREALAIRKKALGDNHPDYALSLNNLAGLYQSRGENARAEPLYRAALAIWKKALGENHPNYAASLNNLAMLYQDMGDYARAVVLHREALAITKKVLGENHPDYATALNNLAALYFAMGDYAGAEPLVREAQAIWKKALGADNPNYASSLDNLAQLYWRMGDCARAEPLLREAVAIKKKALGENHPDYAASLNNLASLYRSMGAFARAEPLFREAVAIWKKTLGENHLNYATSVNNLALLYRGMGDYARAEPLYREALAIRKKALGTNHPDYARSLINLAGLYAAMGDYARAEPLNREALAILKKALGENKPDYATSLNNAASLYQAMGDYARAEPLFREALAIRKSVLGTNHPDYAGSLNDLAALYKDIGDYARAEPLYREALTIFKKAVGENHSHYGTSLSNLAGLYQAKGDFARAEPLFREALAILKKALGMYHPDYAAGLNNLALLYREMGDNARAEPLYREALATCKKAFGMNHPDYAGPLYNLADLYMSMGDYARAEPLYREALTIAKKALGTNHHKYALSLKHLARLYEAMGDHARAEPLCREALEISSRIAGNTSSVLGERQRFRLYQSQRSALDAYLSISRNLGPRPEELYEHVIDWKGAAENRRSEERLARDQPELAPTLARLAQVRGLLANLAFQSPAARQADAWREQLNRLREAKEDLEADLTRRSAGYRAQKQAERLNSAEVAAALPARTALVDFLEYTHFTPTQGGKGPFQSERRLLAFVLRRARPVATVSLGQARTIDESVRTWRRALDSRRGGALQTAAAELGRRLWEPLKPHLGDARTILIAPDGLLSFFPFAALPGSKSGSYLIEDLAIAYIASGRHAVQALAEPTALAGRGLLAVGDVDFQADPGQSVPSARTELGVRVIAQRTGFKPLPGTGPEARRACALFQAAFADQPAEVLTRVGPTEAEIKRRIDGGHLRVVHLGTHGFFESPARVAALRASALPEHAFALTVEPNKPGESDADFALTPLLRSGVVLAGGGREPDAGLPDLSSDAPAREDGILTAEEVHSLDLRGTELVVLSACETGLGVSEYGQGVLGLQRAFQAAGARATVASLWKVDDTATTVLMEQFYTNLWVKKLTKLEALRQAQLAVLNDPGLVTKRRAELAKERGIGETAVKVPDGGRVGTPNSRDARSDPSLWAAFVLSGDVR
jgi:tetratricopeptide (TPR) repeat protein